MGIWAKFSEPNTAIVPIAVSLQTYRGAELFIAQKSKTGVVKKHTEMSSLTGINMGALVSLFMWKENLRSDCFLNNRVFVMVSKVGEKVVLKQDTSPTAQGEIGMTMEVVEIMVPRNLLEGDYAISVNETYNCSQNSYTFQYPSVKFQLFF
jgi:hypothetical protein